MNDDQADPNCHSVKGIIKAYKETLCRVTLSAPTHFAPILNQLIEIIETNSKENFYFVLLIITDGLNADKYNFMKAIIDSSFLPTSTVIIGVGEVDLTDLKNLVSKLVTTDDGYSAKRRNIIFVDMKDFSTGEISKVLLRQIQEHVMEYMDQKNIVPGENTLVIL